MYEKRIQKDIGVQLAGIACHGILCHAGTGQDAEAEQNEAVYAGGAEKNAESEKYEKEGNLEKFKTENRESFKEGSPDSEEARKSHRKGEGRKKDAEM